MDNAFKSPTVISFCPGILGIERGLARAGTHCRVAAYVEIEAFIIANLVAGMESGVLDPAPIWTDAKTFDAHPFRGRIHGIIGGYPCPGESLAGLREGHLYKGFIWPAIRRAIAAARPLFCFFENVDDHLTGTYPIVQRSLRNMGYAVEAGVFSAEEVGAPHERKRLFILAVADSYRNGAGRHTGNLFSQSREIKAEEQGQNRQRSGNEFGHSSEEVGDAQGINQQYDFLQPRERQFKNRGSGEKVGNPERQGLALGEKQSAWKECSTIKRTDRIVWPAGQGTYQHEWEEPRTIEPGVGCTIDGYNFRSDLLRAAGNSVVEQTAELAWRVLMNKHFDR